MKLIPDIYDKIGIVLREMLGELGNSTTFTSSEVYPFYVQRYPQDEEMMEKLGICTLKMYVPGMVWEYSKKVYDRDPDKPVIEFLGKKTYRFASDLISENSFSKEGASIPSRSSGDYIPHKDDFETADQEKEIMDSTPKGEGFLTNVRIDARATNQLFHNNPFYPVRLNTSRVKRFENPAPWSVLNKCLMDLISCSEDESISIWNTFETSLWNELTLEAKDWNLLNRLSIYEQDSLDTALTLSFDYLLLIADDELFYNIIGYIIYKANKCLKSQNKLNADRLFEDNSIITMADITNIKHFYISSFDFNFSFEELTVSFDIRRWQDFVGISEKNIFQKCGFRQASFRLIKLAWQLRSFLKIVDDFISSPQIISPYNYSQFDIFLTAILNRSIKKPKDISKRIVDIILDRIGVVDGKPKTLEALGQKYVLTRERVRQIEKEYSDKLAVKAIQQELLPTFWIAITELLNEEGGMIDLSELAEKISRRFRWKSPPYLAPLIWILKFRKEFEVDEKHKSVRLELEVKAKGERCTDCDKLFFIIQKMVFLNQSHISLADFISKIIEICKENCNSRGFFSKMVDRKFVAKLLDRNRGLYVIEGDYVISIANKEFEEDNTVPASGDDHESSGFDKTFEYQEQKDSARLLIRRRKITKINL